MANISDVAALAGVSRQTVSRVLNEEATVSPATRVRVDDAIRRLSYRPSAAARALVTRRTHTIGLVTTGAPLYGPSSTMLGFNEAARAAGFRVLTASLAASVRVGEAIEVLLGQGVEALVLIATDYTALDTVDGLDVGVPLLTAESSRRPGHHSVSIDQFAGAVMVTEHLVELGHRGILHLAGPAGSVDAAERTRGWRTVLDHHGLPIPPTLEGDWQPSSGYEAGRRCVDPIERGEVTAVFCANDQMAVGLIHALADAGIRVPEQVAVAGFDDVPEAAHFLPPLTTVRQDFRELGVRMMVALEAILRGVAPPVLEQALPELVIRGSTGPAAVGSAELDH